MKRIAILALKYSLILSLFLCFKLNVQAQAVCPLLKGDIFISAYDMADDQNNGTTKDDRFSFVMLKKVNAGQIIFFTDFGYINATNQFQTPVKAVSDGIIKWTADKDYEAGTEIIINCKFTLKATLKDNTTAAGTVTSALESYNTRVLYTGDPKEYMSLAEFSGDQIFAFLLPATNGATDFTTGITFLAGVSANVSSGGWATNLSANVSDASLSELPAQLNSGAQNLTLSFNNNDNTDGFTNDGFAGRHKNKITNTSAAILADANTTANWEYASNFYPDPNFVPLLTPANYALSPLTLGIVADRLNICRNTATTFTAVTTNACSYQWQTRTSAGTFTDISNGGIYGNSATTNTLTISSGNTVDGNYYRVLVRGNGGTQTSNEARLTTVDPVIVLTSAALPASFKGTAYPNQTIGIVSGGAAPYAFSSTGTLPPGLTLSPTTGVISGTPTLSGTFNFTVTATSTCASTGFRAYSIVIKEILVTPATLAAQPTIGQAYTQAFTGTGGTAPYSYAISAGSLPAGLTLSAATGNITGTATASGNFNFTVSATDSSPLPGPYSGSTNYSITTNVPTIIVGPTTLNPSTAGAAYSQTVTASGGTAPYTFVISSGTLPAGLTLAANGTLTGTPTAAGIFNLSIRATDSSTGTGAPFSGTRAYTIIVNTPVITINPTTIPNAVIGTAYSQTLTAGNGTAPYTFAITAGGLPTGLTLSATGLLSGTPTAGGTFNFTVSAQDATTGAGAPFSGARAYSMTVTPPTITITPTTIPAAVAGAFYSQNLTASGGTSGYSYAVTAGTLPAGITFNSAGLLSGVARGTGTFNFVVTATDASTGAGPYTGARAYTFSVGAPVIIVTPASLPSATIALAYSQTLGSAGGTAPYTYAITAGSLPTGLTLSTGGVISGTPTGGGFFNFTVTATDATTGGTYGGSKVYSLNVNAPAITLTLTAATVTIGVPYSRTVTAAGGTAPYTFAITAGALPAGLTLASNGVLSGTPTAGGNFNFAITATDNSTGAGPYTGLQNYAISVAAPTISITPATLSNGVAGIAYVPASITSSGGTAPYTYAISTGLLPAGLSLSAGGVLSGTPTAAGTFNFTVRATDASTGSGPYAASRVYTMTIGAPTIAVSPATLSNGTLGTTYNETITATGGTTPHTFAISTGALPAGLTLSPNGVLSGTPAVFGNFNFTVMATDQTTGAGPFNASRGYTLSIQFSPKITSATYDAATGTLAVTGTGFPPSSPTADVSKLVVKANGFTYPLTAATVSNSSATSFTAVLNATDRLAVMLNKNGTTGVDGSTYNLSAVTNWFTGAPADATGGVITVSNVSLPTISSAVYNASTSELIVTGTNLIAYPGAGNDIAVSKLAITAEGNTYTLTSADVELSSATTFAVTLNAADQLALKPLFNKNGTQSTNGTIYNIAAAEDWLKAADPAANIADLTSNGITVNNVAIPTITSATYQTSTGTLTVTGANLLSLSGTANDIVASKFTIKGEGGSTYTLTNTPNVDITNTTTFTLTLSTIDQLGVNAIVNKNGTSSTNGTIYNLAAADDWAAGADAAVDVTDLLGNGINVNGVAVPAITSAVYDAASGQLVVTGTGFLFLSGTANDIVANKFTFIGQGGSSYNLTNTPNVDITSATEFTLTLSATDKAALKPLLNKNGTSSRGGTTYNLAALEDWNAGADASVNIVDLVNTLTAVNALSTVADLSSLTTSAGSLNPSFATNTTTYTVNTVTTSNTATVTAVLADLTATMEVSVNAGTYTALSNNTASGNLPLNFGNNIINVKVTAEDASVKTYTLTVNRPNASQTITLAPTASVAYGTPDYDPGATSTTSAINAITYTSSDATVATIVNGKIHIVGLGITNIIAKQAGSLGFDAAPDAQQVLTVIKGTASIALSNLAQIYDGTAKAVNATTTPAGLSGVSITYNGSAIAPIAAGTYLVAASLANTNYDAPNATGSLVIAPKAITVTADAQSKTYGSADPALTYSVPAGSLVGADAITGSLNRAPGESVGTYAIGQNTLTAGNNYTITYAPANLTIGTKAITVTADAKSKTYGSADPALTYSIPAGSLVGTDVITGSLNRAPGEAVGTYAIGQNTLTAGNNYTITYAPASLTIGTKTITVTADAKSKTYGSADPALTYSVPAGSLVGTDAITGSLNRAPGENVGVYAIGQNTLTAGNNYTITYAPANLTIGAKTITVTADAKSKTYGSADPALTYSVPAGSLVGTDAITGSLNRAPGENVGTYAIGQNTLTAGNNYTITYAPANLTIGTKTITVTADAKSKTYGSADPALTYSVPAGSLVGTDAITGSLNRAPGENVGTYAIGQNTLTAGNNYTITYVPANLSVGTKSITVTADAKSKTYGSADPALTYSVPAGSLVGTDAITGSLNRAPGESVGTYAIGQNTLTAGNNYTITYAPANLTIGTKSITVTADAKSKTYGSVDPALTYSVPAGSLVGTDAITGSLNRAPGESVGTYAIGQNTLTAGNNYTITYVPANLTIGTKAITVTADAKSKTYGSADPALTYSVPAGSLVGTDAITGSLNRAPGENVGTYAIGQNTLTAGNNYTITYNTANLTINPKALTITADGKTRVFGVANPVLTVSYSGFITGESSTVLTSPAVISTTATITSPSGTYPITASGAAAANYSISYVPGSLVITATSQSITFAALASKLSTDAPFTLTATATSGLAVSYSSSDVSVARIINGNQVEILKAGVVTITASQAGNGNYTAAAAVNQSLTVLDNPAPIISIVSSKGNSISKGITTVLTASGALTYSWSNASGIISGQNTASLTVRPAQTTTYTVTGANQYGRTSTQSITIEVLADYKALNITNALSPNGDGVNDFWIVENIDMYPNNTVKIVDRSGRSVYEKKGYDNSWDGNFRGAQLAEGTYYYIIDFGPGIGFRKGFITIVR